jgi:hypothetical protein
MAEPIGGKEFEWKSLTPSVLAPDLNRSALVLGWIMIIVLPVVFSLTLLQFQPWLERPWANHEFKSFKGFEPLWKPSLIWISTLILWVMGLIASILWFLTAIISLWFLRTPSVPVQQNNVRKKSSESVKKSSTGESANDSVSNAKTEAIDSKSTSAANMAPVSVSRNKEEADREIKEKIKQARKSFEDKVSNLKGLIPPRFEFKVDGDSLELGKFFSESGLKGEIKASLLKPYLSLEPDTLTVSVTDPSLFCRDDKCVLKIDVTCPIAKADPDLKDEFPARELTVVILAAYASSLKKFVAWREKVPPLIRLKNVKQGDEVSVNVSDEIGLSSEWASVENLQLPAGLAYDPVKSMLTGMPEVGSDMKIAVTVACNESTRLKHEVTFLLTCNMDPELKWKDIERDQSDDAPIVSEEDKLKLVKMAEAVRSTASAYEVPRPDDIFSKPSRVSRRQKSEGFDLAYASIRGRSHIRSGSFREDHAEAEFFLGGKAVAIVVSDGAGSAPLSRRGSCIVATVGIKCLIELGHKLVNDPEALKGRSETAIDGFAAAVQSIRSQIGVEAECIKAQYPDFLAKEMYATFLAALVLPTASGHVLLTYSVGDGAIGLAFAGDFSGSKCVADHGQSAGQTLFILNKGAEDAGRRLAFTPLPESYALLLMSDGVSDPRIQQGEELKPDVWNQLGNELKPLVMGEPITKDAERIETYKERGPLCTWLDSYEKGHHDDRTIAVLFHKLS